MQWIHRLVLAVTLIAGLALPASAQTISQSDIQRLHEDAAQAARSVQQVRGRDEALGQQLRSQLDDLEDEIIYLKVKLRKENTLSRSEYNDVRDRIDGVRTRASDEY